MNGAGEISHCFRLFLGWTPAAVITLCPVLAVEVLHRLCSLPLKQPDLVGTLVAELVVLKVPKRIVRHRKRVRLDRPFDRAETDLDDGRVVPILRLKRVNDLEEATRF